jgi:hypothetical protein
MCCQAVAQASLLDFMLGDKMPMSPVATWNRGCCNLQLESRPARLKARTLTLLTTVITELHSITAIETSLPALLKRHSGCLAVQLA